MYDYEEITEDLWTIKYLSLQNPFEQYNLCTAIIITKSQTEGIKSF